MLNQSQVNKKNLIASNLISAFLYLHPLCVTSEAVHFAYNRPIEADREPTRQWMTNYPQGYERRAVRQRQLSFLSDMTVVSCYSCIVEEVSVDRL